MAGLSEKDIEVFLNTLIDLAEPVMVRYQWRPQLRDPNDEMILETAFNGHAHAIVTFNRKDYGSAPERFGIEVISPGEALRRIRK